MRKQIMDVKLNCYGDSTQLKSPELKVHYQMQFGIIVFYRIFLSAHSKPS